MCADIQTLCRAAKAPLAFDILLSTCTSFSEFPSLVTLLPRYTNSSTSSKAVLLMVTGSSFFALIFHVFRLCDVDIKASLFSK